ncbi:uncharacterized protein BO88DRAFT_430371 [Aspergillus vadensis CBS 113365]|uniref:Uncharacterized protein n=1 Tax=Aspergillus vadensis (strain CBS 113365 / IMI 142717 / IBT 24658) TaxID=1448311 RepID=A0A319AW25_ASPVC|nr:hypothetical protein BO88DRAFT_430371 [Aspergillus vadensis CBS 113365]PYH63571.1 hypothetical protein BO88DRAFT_430371 [Aspergillus vadensis CBS 113365]
MVAREKALTIGLNRRNDWMDRLISARDSAEQGQHPSRGHVSVGKQSLGDGGKEPMADGLNPAEHFVLKLRRNTTRGGECQVANLTGVKHILSAFVRRQTSRALFRIWTTDDRSSGPFCLDWGPWIAYATLARIGWLARQLDSDEDTCTSSSSSLLFLWSAAMADSRTKRVKDARINKNSPPSKFAVARRHQMDG